MFSITGLGFQRKINRCRSKISDMLIFNQVASCQETSRPADFGQFLQIMASLLTAAILDRPWFTLLIRITEGTEGTEDVTLNQCDIYWPSCWPCTPV